MRLFSFLLFWSIAFPTLPHGGDSEAIMHIIKEIKLGWEQGDGTPFRNHFLDFKGARYIESGGQNVGLDDLVLNHVEPEKDALTFLTLDFSEVEIHRKGDFAWALANTHVQGEVRKSGRKFNKKGFQTFIFQKINDHWKVLHTHSSGKNITTQEHRE